MVGTLNGVRVYAEGTVTCEAARRLSELRHERNASTCIVAVLLLATAVHIDWHWYIGRRWPTTRWKAAACNAIQAGPPSPSGVGGTGFLLYVVTRPMLVARTYPSRWPTMSR